MGKERNIVDPVLLEELFESLHHVFGPTHLSKQLNNVQKEGWLGGSFNRDKIRTEQSTINVNEKQMQSWMRLMKCKLS